MPLSDELLRFQRGGRAGVPPTPQTGLIFPGNQDGGGTVRFELLGSAKPDIVPLTILWDFYPIQQTGYYTTFFYARTDGTFADNYFGCHPYPRGGASGTVHDWEISIDGRDVLGDIVTKGQWYRQAATADNVASAGVVNFYYDLATGLGEVISETLTTALVTPGTAPGIVWGDAPWAPNTERLSGYLRGMQVYNAVLSTTHIASLSVLQTDSAILDYCTSNSITSLWYLNKNPTPDDITDKSGAGHNPTWLNSNRPTLWEG